MTLILTRASKDYVLQVTDRLVSYRGEEFDSIANKNIVFATGNAIVAMGYTGHAFVGTLPTDQWIVETLTGHTFDRDRKPPAISYTRTRNVDLGRALAHLQEALSSPPVTQKWRANWRATTFDVCVVGWQWKKSRARPFGACQAF